MEPVTPHQETAYTRLADAMRDLNAEISKGEPRFALTSRMGGPFQWEQVAGRPQKPAFDMERIRAAVAARLPSGL